MTKSSQVILDKNYTAEELVDVDDDIRWALSEYGVPLGDDGFHEGNFEVLVTLTHSTQFTGHGESESYENTIGDGLDEYDGYDDDHSYNYFDD